MSESGSLPRPFVEFHKNWILIRSRFLPHILARFENKKYFERNKSLSATNVRLSQLENILTYQYEHTTEKHRVVSGAGSLDPFTVSDCVRVFILLCLMFNVNSAKDTIGTMHCDPCCYH